MVHYIVLFSALPAFLLDLVPHISPLSTFLVTLILGAGSYLSVIVTDGLKTYSSWLDRQSPTIKKILSVVIAAAIGTLLTLMSQSLNPVVGAIITVLGQAGLFRQQKRTANALAGGSGDASTAVK